MMLHCGAIMKNRFAILDIHNGYQNKVDSVAAFRNAINDNTEASYSAAYYPWLNTAVLNDDNVNFDNLSTMGKKTLKAIIEKERVAFKGDSSTSAHYDTILKAIQHKLNLLPPSGAMAGLYTLTDNSKGVWQSPANVSIACVISPSVNISAQEQEALNVDLNGKSINALRLFAGEGTLVWGARTLNGNSLDWRYISVRRTVIMLEQSIMLAAKAYVFEPNDANTWITVKSMITNFLTGIWKQGGLAGADPSDAFSVNVGLGETMTGNDILDGRLIISVKVAITRPAEFIEISFTQLMQKS
jgi:phage tail sheath protein FI